MKSEIEITKSIGEGLMETASKVLGERGLDDFRVHITTERIFLDRFIMRDEAGSPTLSYGKDIFFVIKLTAGAYNFALATIPVEIECVSEVGTTTIGYDILREYAEAVNFRYLFGMVQTYYTPNVQDPMKETMDGIRATVTVRGQVRVPEDGVMFYTNLYYDDGSGEEIDVPFITVIPNRSSSPDPVPFPNLDAEGSTMAMNRFATRTLTVVTYFRDFYSAFPTSDYEGNKDGLAFTKAVFDATNGNMNRKFRLRLQTNIPDGSGGYLSDMDYAYIITSRATNQNYGDISPSSLSFAQAKEED